MFLKWVVVHGVEGCCDSLYFGSLVADLVLRADHLLPWTTNIWALSADWDHS